MSSILCVIDLTDATLPVMEVAAKMARSSGAILSVLFPFRLIEDGYQGKITSLRSSLEKKAAEKFQAFRSRVGAMDQLDYQFRPEVGFVGDSIQSSVIENKPEMIVIGQHMASTVETNGMSLYELIKNSRLPFVIVPEEIDSEVLFN